MDQTWFGQVARMNEAIAAAETRLSEQVSVLIETAERGQSTTEAETLVEACRHHLGLLHSLQADLLRKDEISESIGLGGTATAPNLLKIHSQ